MGDLTLPVAAVTRLRMKMTDTRVYRVEAKVPRWGDPYGDPLSPMVWRTLHAVDGLDLQRGIDLFERLYRAIPMNDDTQTPDAWQLALDQRVSKLRTTVAQRAPEREVRLDFDRIGGPITWR